MNGIWEDIKGVMSLRLGNFDYCEVLFVFVGCVEVFEVSII